MAKGPMVLYHIFAPAVPVMCSPHALKAEIIPVHLPDQENASKHSHLQPQGLSAPARSWGFFIYDSLTLLNNEYKPVIVHSKSK